MSVSVCRGKLDSISKSEILHNNLCFEYGSKDKVFFLIQRHHSWLLSCPFQLYATQIARIFYWGGLDQCWVLICTVIVFLKFYFDYFSLTKPFIFSYRRWFVNSSRHTPSPVEQHSIPSTLTHSFSWWVT